MVTREPMATRIDDKELLSVLQKLNSIGLSPDILVETYDRRAKEFLQTRTGQVQAAISDMPNTFCADPEIQSKRCPVSKFKPGEVFTITVGKEYFIVAKDHICRPGSIFLEDSALGHNSWEFFGRTPWCFALMCEYFSQQCDFFQLRDKLSKKSESDRKTFRDDVVFYGFYELLSYQPTTREPISIYAMDEQLTFQSSSIARTVSSKLPDIFSNAGGRYENDWGKDSTSPFIDVRINGIRKFIPTSVEIHSDGIHFVDEKKNPCSFRVCFLGDSPRNEIPFTQSEGKGYTLIGQACRPASPTSVTVNIPLVQEKPTMHSSFRFQFYDANLRLTKIVLKGFVCETLGLESIQ